jgi:hypothetical protein
MDTSLTPILTVEHVNPDVLSERGLVSYTTSTNPNDWEEIAGTDPLRVVAREVFGRYPTDIILSRKDANRLLSVDSNRTLLADGKVVVVVNPAVVAESF